MMQCIAISKSGEQCKHNATVDGYCKTHVAKIKVEQLLGEEPEIGQKIVPVGLNTIEQIVPAAIPLEEPKPTHKVTAPWNSEDNPWSINKLKLKNKHKGFNPRFVVNNPENIEKYLELGWVIADRKDYGGVSAQILGEKGKLDSTIKRRELILMELPEELVKSRAEYLDYKTNKRITTDNEIKDVEKKLGSKVLMEDRTDSRKARHI